ncbi:hypothetical protein FKW77_004955 [Venturia effusa]|uniref:Uncharacterized protein n=1 Tax=Venturia effusa TaxID=50376 RepID=A0A517LQ37_9PEZI|nr:hypothetical protein FKW77_004955 [Venturia effusa]
MWRAGPANVTVLKKPLCRCQARILGSELQQGRRRQDASEVLMSQLSRFPTATSAIDLGESACRPLCSQLGKIYQPTEKLAIVYATPPLSPSAQRSLEAPGASLKIRSGGMDSNDRRHRQSSGYASQQGLIQSSPQYPATSSSERYRQQPHLAVQSPASASTTGRSGTLPGYNYPYAAEGSQFGSSAMNAGPMQYSAEYAPDATQRSQQQQPYQQYGSNIMYNVPSQQQQPSPQSAYETVQPYQPRQTAAALEVLTNQFAVPQPYYEGGPTSAPASAIAAQSTQYTSLSYTTQSPVGREPLTSAYATGMADANQGSSQGAYGQTNYAAAELDSAYGQYQTELKRTFECIHWLLGNAEALGLVRDDETMHRDRIKLWEEFNTAWLSALQRQKEMTMEMLDTGQRPHHPQSLLEADQMEGMGKELVRLCDIMEKHGLVDYQMGVWEEEIITRKVHSGVLTSVTTADTLQFSTRASIC